jgi:hypothetical protein
MRVYLDTGLFIDYICGRGVSGEGLRATRRRGRSPQKLFDDADALFTLIGQKHAGATSALTCCEVEEAYYKVLAARPSVSPWRNVFLNLRKGRMVGPAYRRQFLVPAARSMVPQMLLAAQLFGVQICDLTLQTANAQLALVVLQTSGIRAADALHVTSASLWAADVVVSADSGVLSLDGQVPNARGALMRCWDSDVALANL